MLYRICGTQLVNNWKQSWPRMSVNLSPILPFHNLSLNAIPTLLWHKVLIKDLLG